MRNLSADSQWVCSGEQGWWFHTQTNKYTNKQVQCVTEVFSEAVPITYCPTVPAEDFAELGRLVLCGTYEAVLLVGALVTSRDSRPRVPVLLTKVGGGVFGYPREWIVDGINWAVQAATRRCVNVDAAVVHSRQLESGYQDLGPAWEWSKPLPP